MTDVSRRKFVAAGGAAWASTALAGCTGGDDGGDDTTEPATDSPTDTQTPEPQPESYVVTDTLRVGSEFVPYGASNLFSSCSASRTFAPGMQVVFYVGVFDPETGDPISPDNIEGVSISTSIGESADLGWTEDAGEWHGNLVLPVDTEPGTVTYEINVSTEASSTHLTLRERQFEVVQFENSAGNYVVTDQTYALGSIDSNPPEDYPYSKGCLEQDIFSPDLGVGFDIGIWNGQTGEMVGADDIESAELQFTNADMDPVELSFAPANDDETNGEWDRTDDEGNVSEDHAWNAVIRSIPEDFAESGGKKLKYEVVVTPMAPEDASDAYTGPEVNPVGVYRNYITIVPTPSSSS